MTHEAMRALLPDYAAGVLSDASVELVQRHLAEGCLECLHDVFTRPLGLSHAPTPARREDPPARPSTSVVGAVVVGIALVSIAVAASMTSNREAAPDVARLEAPRTSPPVPEETEVADLERALEAARLRIASLKENLRRQAVDFREKRQSMDALLAARPSATAPAGRQPGCARLAEPARDVCVAFCDVHGCERGDGPECAPLRARYRALTGSDMPACATARAAGTLAPCDESHLALWSFPVARGRRYTVTADTVEAPTAADLCFVGSCEDLESFAGDDELPCRTAPGVGCPRASFVAAADATCTVAVTLCSPGCGARPAAPYELTVEGAESLARLAD